MRPHVLLLIWVNLARSLQDALICPAGKYFFNGVCELCPDNCRTCYSASICSECKTGYYGESCAMVCNVNCRDNVCDISKGVCISCSEGYFKDTNQDCTACPSNCSVCSSDTLCTKCKVGFKGRQCQEVCTNCKPGTACDIWTGVCYECEQGHTGEACDENCDSKCFLCQRLHGDTCIACSNDKYGETCENDCPLHCVNKMCNDSNGFCTHGCHNGYWGTLCENKCMTGCNSSICYKQNGSCLLQYPDGDMGTERNCPNDCTCDAQDICHECDPESEFMCGKQCPLTCQKQFCFRNSSCLLPGDDLNTQPSKRSPGTIVLYVATVLIFVVVMLLQCYMYYREIKRRTLCNRSATTGDHSEDRCWKLLCPLKKTRREKDSRASSKDINDADTFQENAPLQRSL